MILANNDEEISGTALKGCTAFLVGLCKEEQK